MTCYGVGTEPVSDVDDDSTEISYSPYYYDVGSMPVLYTGQHLFYPEITQILFYSKSSKQQALHCVTGRGQRLESILFSQ